MGAVKAPESERRGAPRVPAHLLVMIEGLDEDYRPARGNISATGVLLELPSAPGAPGDLELLHLATLDRERRVAIMGQIVRCVTIDTMGDRAPRVAVVFQFLPERPEVKKALAHLITHNLELSHQDPDFALDHRFAVEVETPEKKQPKAATVFRLQVKWMSLETTWPVNVGDHVQLAFRSGGTKLPFEGRVTKVEPRAHTKRPRYTVEVRLAELGERIGPSTAPPPPTTDSIDLVLSDLLTGDAPLPELTQRHLSGRLDRIPMPSLLTFLEMERQTGHLTLEDTDNSTLFIDQGRVVDVDPRTDEPRAQLERLLGRQQGRFAFTCDTVDREDRVQQSTTHILLDWARREDEAGN